MERAEAGRLERARRCRWAVVGRSAHPDAASAGREAARSALAAHDDARLLIVFASSDHDLRAVADGIAEAAPGVPVVGTTTAGELDAAGPVQGSVQALALGGDGFSFSATAVSAAADPRAAGARAAACVGDVADAPHRVLLLLSDGSNETQPDIVRGAYSVAGAGVPLVGGLAGHRAPDDGGEPELLYGNAVLKGAVVGVAIGSDAPIGVGVRHGWHPVGEPMLVTRVAAGRVLELDGRPAATVYRERLGGDPDVPVTVAATLTHPLGMRRRVGEAHARWVDDDGAEDGSLRGVVPAGALVWLMDSDADGVIDATDAACGEALGALGDDPPLAVVAFDCNARLMILGDDGARDEVARMAAHAGDAALTGWYTFGEIARTRGTAGVHQQTLVVLALA